MSSSFPSSEDINPINLADAPNKGYELSGKIMLSAIVILFAVVIFMVFLHLYARWYLLRARRRQLQRRNRNRRQNIVFSVDSAATPAAGLDQSVLKTLPVFVFDEGLGEKGEVCECAVCLSEFEDGEKGRSLPKCSHSFHIDCIDMWFASHSTCPLCRAPVKSVAEIRNSDEVSQLDDSVSLPESGSVETPVADSATLALAGGRTPSFGAIRGNAQVDLKGYSIEIPIRNELTENEPPTESPHSYKSPGGRMMSIRRMLSLGLSMSSPSKADVSSSSACCDLEMGAREEAGRTRSFR